MWLFAYTGVGRIHKPILHHVHVCGQVGKQQQARYVHSPPPERCSCFSPIPVKVNVFVKHSLGGDGRFSASSYVSYLVEFICSHSSNFCFYWPLRVPLVQIVVRGALKNNLSWAAGKSSSAKYLCYLTCFPSHVIFLSCMKIHVKQDEEPEHIPVNESCLLWAVTPWLST